MTIWALADLHLAFGAPDKSMEVFGPQWSDYSTRIQDQWNELVDPDDLVLVAGDISWAMKLDRAMLDLEWIDALPGTKVMIRGNHDYWWSSPTKVRKSLPPSIHIIQNDAFHWGDVSIAGTRLWDCPDFHFSDALAENTAHSKPDDQTEKERIYNRELHRLELSLKQLKPDARLRIAMLHYPPISGTMQESQASRLLEEYNVDVCVFGHLHALNPDTPMFGELNSIQYKLTACDYLKFRPLQID